MSQDAEKDISQRDDSPIVKNFIKENPYKDWKLDKVYCSPLLRAQQTAESLFGEYETVDYIYEYIRPRMLDGVPRKEAKLFWDKHKTESTTDPDWNYDESESFNTIVKRANKFYKHLQTLKYSRLGVVGHGIFFTHLMSIHALGVDNYTIDKYYKLSLYIRQNPLQYLYMEL